MKFFAFFLVFLFLGCTSKFYLQNDFTKDKTKLAINDQNLSKLPKFEGEILVNKIEFLNKFFSPWDENRKEFSKNEAFWALEILKNSNLFFEKDKKISKSFYDEIINNSNVKNYLKISKKAVILHETLIRNLPTTKAIFKDFKKHGKGIPFDLNANTFVNCLTPIFVSHFSKDKKFAFVFSDITSGWVDLKNIKFLNKKEIKDYKNSDFLVVTNSQKFRFGSILPFIKNGENFKIKILNEILDKNEIENFPLKFNDKNIKKVMEKFHLQAYGWGGFMGFKDCSLLMRDFFAIFGVWLPRNSKFQSIMGKKFDISNLNSSKKQKFITKNAQPYQTLLYLPGHIMLYIAPNLVWHSIWGLKTKNDKRAVIGGVVLSQLDIGIYKIPNKNLLINKISSLNILNFPQSVRFDRNLSKFLSLNFADKKDEVFQKTTFFPQTFNVINDKYKDDLKKIEPANNELKEKMKSFVKERTILIGGEIKLENGETNSKFKIK